MFKLQRSQKQVEDYIRARNHEMMLKQELRKLREGDMEKVKQRTKRLENKRKYDILNKEQQDAKLLDEMKTREKALIETRYNNLVKTNIERNNYIDELDSWAKRGFSTTRSTKKKIKLSKSPELEKLSKIAQGIMKDPAEKKAD